ncbi:hypothetical protein mRhiFer1_009375 [Rhinolophus ferrumequinum]|uniref:Uncharacterized protein n=1 Tax=Rhinolophus ferrumequinum TaxID=59479 RepID=A0A7J7RPI8_RHIFE|nr:hypothetical protein mRhiFer1_009375 [Rhinolophus ferrumequinum]
MAWERRGGLSSLILHYPAPQVGRQIAEMGEKWGAWGRLRSGDLQRTGLQRVRAASTVFTAVRVSAACSWNPTPPPTPHPCIQKQALPAAAEKSSLSLRRPGLGLCQNMTPPKALSSGLDVPLASQVPSLEHFASLPQVPKPLPSMALPGVLAAHLQLVTPKRTEGHVGPARRCLQGEVTLSNQERC